MKARLLFIVAMTVALFTSSVALAESPTAFKKCQMCHGKQLKGKKKSPSLNDRSYEELYNSLTVAIPKKMKSLAKKLTEEEKQSIAMYIFQRTWMEE